MIALSRDRISHMLWTKEEAIHVGQLHRVIVIQEEPPDATAGQHLGRHAANTAHALDKKICWFMYVYFVSRLLCGSEEQMTSDLRC